MGPGLERGVVRPDARDDGTAADFGVAVQDGGHHRLPVYRHGQGAAGFRVLEPGLTGVPRHEGELAVGVGDQAEARPIPDPLRVGCAESADDIDFTREQQVRQRGAVGRRAQDDAFEAREPVLEVVRVATQHEFLAGCPVLQQEGAARDQVLEEPGRVAAPLGERPHLPGVLREDESGRDIGQSGGPGGVEMEADRRRVDHFDIGDRLLVERVPPGDIGLGLGQPGKPDILGRHRFAVAPHGVRTQTRGQSQAVLGELPVGRQTGRPGRRTVAEVRLFRHQRQEELVTDRAVRECRKSDQLVRRRILEAHADGEARRVPRDVRSAAPTEHGSQSGRRQEPHRNHGNHRTPRLSCTV